jgi:hypothetical protein
MFIVTALLLRLVLMSFAALRTITLMAHGGVLYLPVTDATTAISNSNGMRLDFLH